MPASPHGVEHLTGRGILGGMEDRVHGTIGQARALRRRSNESEQIVWSWLRDRRFHRCKFRRQHPIGRYVVDFYCDALKLIVEIDGSIHDGRPLTDEIRSQHLLELGYYIMRFRDDDIWHRPMELCRKLDAAIDYLRRFRF